MQPAGLVNSPAAATLRVTAPSVARTWTAGQVLSATVLTAGDGGGASVLRVAGEPVQAQSRVPLQTGQSLRLQVTDAGPPAVLKVLDRGAADGTPALAARVLRAALPEQRPLAESLTRLQRVSEQPRSRHTGDLPEGARALLSDLLASLPRPADAGDGARLAAMVRASGLFYEAELEQRAQPRQADPEAAGARDRGGADFKARVAAVADALRQAVEAGNREGLAKEADSALRAVVARIETNQALSVRGSQEQGALWRMDLPFSDERGAQSVGLRIRRDGSQPRPGDDGGREWVVELDVHPPGGAPLHARVSLSGGAVHALFTTDDPQTLSRLQERGGELRRRLEGEALAVGGVRSRLAALPVDEPPAGLAGLVDERA